MRPPAPLLSVRGLSITHADAARPAPDGASFDIHPGEVVLLLGPSGSGKSTLTLALNGLIPHEVPAELTGSVTAGELDTASHRTAALSTRVAMVFQDPDAQIVTGSVYDEVAFGPENLRLPRDEVCARTEHALRRVDLWERRQDNPDVLSGGGRQRLAIACALAMGSPLIVLDEPTANLDQRGIDDVYAALAEVVSNGDRAILLVEHNLDAAMELITRVLVLGRDGRIAFDGPTDDVIRGHASELLETGVWLPSATLAALRLRNKGIPVERLPLTVTELAESTDSTGYTALRSNRFCLGDDTTRRAPIVRARGLSVRRGRTEILHDIDLDVEEGSLTAIVGANGAGKTTLLQALAGVTTPPRRRIDIAGLDPGTASPHELADRIGFVFQNPEHQFIATTVFDELAHGLRLRKTPTAEIAARVDEMLLRFGLQHRATVHPFRLSGGEKRRLSVGTALITRPRVLALDEPTFGQDRARASELLDVLHGLRAEGTTVLIVTHDLQLVADHSTHTVIVASGRVVAAAATADLLRDGNAFASAGLRLPALQRLLAEPGQER